MSMDHKAFVFDYTAFAGELKPLLEAALRSGDADELVRFVDAQRGELFHPYLETPLDQDWQSSLEKGDVQECGELALTKYYDPMSDIGLSHEWEGVQKTVEELVGDAPSPILGTALVANGNIFDPGLMGTYFQDAVEVLESLALVNRLIESRPDDNSLHRAREMLVQVDAGKGLYVWF